MNIQQYQMQSNGTVAPGGAIPARVGDPRTQAMFNLGLLDSRLPAYRQQQQAQGDVMREAPQPQYNQSMPYQMPQQLPPAAPMQYQFRSPGTMAGPQSMALGGRRRYRPAGYRHPQRDASGNLPGEWDYQQPSPQFSPMTPYVLK